MALNRLFVLSPKDKNAVLISAIESKNVAAVKEKLALRPPLTGRDKYEDAYYVANQVYNEAHEAYQAIHKKYQASPSGDRTRAFLISSLTEAELNLKHATEIMGLINQVKHGYEIDKTESMSSAPAKPSSP